MYKLPEVVETKFAELFGVIHHVMDDLKIAGAEANLNGDFAEVSVRNDSCRKLQELEAEIKAVLDKLTSKHKSQSAKKIVTHRQITNRTRKPSAHLSVKIYDDIIEEKTITDTFVEALKKIGLERVAKLNKKVSAAPLLAKTPTNGYQNQKMIDGWYVTTHVNKNTAISVLEGISKELEIPIQIEVSTMTTGD
jgi:hypothetical protein